LLLSDTNLCGVFATVPKDKSFHDQALRVNTFVRGIVALEIGGSCGDPMSGKGNALWIVGSLLAAILIAAFYLSHKPPPAAAPLRFSKGVRPEAMSIPNAAVKTDRPNRPGAAVHTLEFCGVGNVPIDADDPLAANRYLSGLTSKAWSRWVSAMLDSGNLRARAAGLFLEAKLSDGSAAPSSAEQSRDALVQLAAGGADPAVYAMAV
jgi:hypothetical protein